MKSLTTKFPTRTTVCATTLYTEEEIKDAREIVDNGAFRKDTDPDEMLHAVRVLRRVAKDLRTEAAWATDEADRAAANVMINLRARHKGDF